MGKNYIFSSESVGEGHPDKVSDTISDAVLDACLAQDRRSRVACETLVKSNVVCVGGEITTKAKFDIDQVVRDAIRGIGYVNDDDVFHADSVFINNYLTAQSPDISQGVDAKAASGKATAEQGAGLGLPIVQKIMDLHQGRFDLWTIILDPSVHTRGDLVFEVKGHP